MSYVPKKGARDVSRTRRIVFRLRKLSAKRHKQQLKSENAAPAKRVNTKVTFKARIPLNKIGTRQGMHVAGDSEKMKKIRSMRKIYNRQMPVLQCSNCAFANSCPQFKAGYECAYLPFLHSHKIESETDLMDAMKNMCEASMTRAHRQTMMETLQGGMPSLETSESMNMAFMQLKQLHDTMIENSAEVSLETEDETIIGKIFGGLASLIEDTERAHDTPIQVAPVIYGTEPTQLTEPRNDVNLDLIREHSRSEVESVTGVRRDRNHNERVRQAIINVSELTV